MNLWVPLTDTLLRHGRITRECFVRHHGLLESCELVGSVLLNGGKLLIGVRPYLPDNVEVSYASYSIPGESVSAVNRMIPDWLVALIEWHCHPGRGKPVPSSVDRDNLEKGGRLMSSIQRLRVTANRMRRLPGKWLEGEYLFELSPSVKIRLLGDGSDIPEISVTTEAEVIYYVGVIAPSEFPVGGDVSKIAAHGMRYEFRPGRKDPLVTYLPELKVVRISDQHAAKLIGRPLSDIAYDIDPQAIEEEVKTKFKRPAPTVSAWSGYDYGAGYGEYYSSPVGPGSGPVIGWGGIAPLPLPEPPKSEEFIYLDEKTSTRHDLARVMMEAAMLIVGRGDAVRPDEWCFLPPTATPKEIATAVAEAASLLQRLQYH